MDAFAQPQDRSVTIGPRFDYLALAPAAAAICYALLLWAFHADVGAPAATPSPSAMVGATLIPAVAFVVPFLALALASGPMPIRGRGGSPMSAFAPAIPLWILQRNNSAAVMPGDDGISPSGKSDA